jgi:hypothetical protein
MKITVHFLHAGQKALSEEQASIIKTQFHQNFPFVPFAVNLSSTPQQRNHHMDARLESSAKTCR